MLAIKAAMAFVTVTLACSRRSGYCDFYSLIETLGILRGIGGNSVRRQVYGMREQQAEPTK